MISCEFGRNPIRLSDRSRTSSSHLERAMAVLNDAAAISDELGKTFWRA